MSDKPHIVIRVGALEAFAVHDEFPADAQEYVCNRFHGDIGRDVIEIRVADDTTGPICVRCFANLVRSCRALPKPAEPETPPEEEGGESE
jgi:hypothetical protein